MKTKYILVLALVLSLNLYAQKEFVVSISEDGQPVLLFAGFACTGEVYQDLVGELSKNHKVYNFTFAGFGDVPKFGLRVLYSLFLLYLLAIISVRNHANFWI